MRKPPEGPRVTHSSAAYFHRLCHTLSLAEGGLSGSGSVRGQAKASVPAGDHKKYTITPHPNKTLSWERRNQEAFQFSLPSPPCRPQAARNCPTHSLSLLSPPPQRVGWGWGQLQLQHHDSGAKDPCCESNSNYSTRWREELTPEASELRRGETRHSGEKTDNQRPCSYQSCHVLIKVTI